MHAALAQLSQSLAPQRAAPFGSNLRAGERSRVVPLPLRSSPPPPPRQSWGLAAQYSHTVWPAFHDKWLACSGLPICLQCPVRHALRETSIPRAARTMKKSLTLASRGPAPGGTYVGSHRRATIAASRAHPRAARATRPPRKPGDQSEGRLAAHGASQSLRAAQAPMPLVRHEYLRPLRQAASLPEQPIYVQHTEHRAKHDPIPHVRRACLCWPRQTAAIAAMLARFPCHAAGQCWHLTWTKHIVQQSGAPGFNPHRCQVDLPLRKGRFKARELAKAGDCSTKVGGAGLKAPMNQGKTVLGL